MNYTKEDLKGVMEMIAKVKLNVTTKEWLSHLYQRMEELLNDQEKVNFCNLDKKLLNGAKTWHHYISTASADIAYDIDLLNRHFAYDQEKVNKWLDKENDQCGKRLYNLTAYDILQAESILRYALQVQHTINKLK